MSNASASRGSNMLMHFLVIAIVLAVSASLYKYLIKNDFLLYIKAPCDAEVESCFVEECDSEDPRCIDAENGQFVYKIIYKKQNQIVCLGGDCPEIHCEQDEESCEEFTCSEENVIAFDLSATCS